MLGEISIPHELALDKAAHWRRPGSVFGERQCRCGRSGRRDTVETSPSPQSGSRCSSLGSRRIGVNPDWCNRRQKGSLGDENECPMPADWLDGLIVTISASRRRATRFPNGPRSGSASSLIDAGIQTHPTLTRK